MDHALHRPVRTTTSSRDDLTTAPQGLTKKQWNTTDSEVGESVTPSHTINRSGQTRQCHPAHRWIEAKPVLDVPNAQALLASEAWALSRDFRQPQRA